MHALDYAHLTSVLWGVCKRLQGRLAAGRRTRDKQTRHGGSKGPGRRLQREGPCRGGAQRPAAGRPDRLQPEHQGPHQVRPRGDGRLHQGGGRGAAAEQERRGRGHHLGNEFAALNRKLPAAAVHRTKPPKDRNATAVVDRASRRSRRTLPRQGVRATTSSSQQPARTRPSTGRRGVPNGFYST